MSTPGPGLDCRGPRGHAPRPDTPPPAPGGPRVGPAKPVVDGNDWAALELHFVDHPDHILDCIDFCELTIRARGERVRDALTLIGMRARLKQNFEYDKVVDELGRWFRGDLQHRRDVASWAKTLRT